MYIQQAAGQKARLREIRDMTVYNFNRGIGWASSGVEYAQAYRAEVFRRIGVKARFIFTDLFRMENIEAMTKAIGFRDEEVIWLYQYFTDFHTGPCTVREEDLEKTFRDGNFTKLQLSDHVQYTFSGKDMFVNAYHTKGSGTFVQRVEYVCGGYLLRTDYYSYARMFSEFYAPKNGKAVLYLRRFYNENGSTAYEEYPDGEKSMFRIGSRLVDSKERLIALLVQSLHLTREDVCICDRSTEIGRGLFENRGKARLVIVIHADHYSKNSTDDRNVLWNNYYEYDFSLAGEKNICYVSSTSAQTKLLRAQFAKYEGLHPALVTIPVGALSGLRRGENRKPFSLITASRLATEKHVDWIVSAVAEAKKKLPELSLDIYGRGAQEKSLRDQIQKAGAEGYIHLCGHRNLDEIYQNYAAYISGSTSEGFGLSLMEAVGSGLAMVGFDVPYGNPTFIEDGENGVLLPYGEDTDPKEAVRLLTDGIVRLFSMDVEKLSARSLEIAAPYLSENIEAKWKALLERSVWEETS